MATGRRRQTDRAIASFGNIAQAFEPDLTAENRKTPFPGPF